MGFIKAAAKRSAAQSSGIFNPSNWLVDFLSGGRRSPTGINVTELRSLQSTAVYACVKILAETIASLPLHVYRRLPEGGKARAPDYPLYSILHDIANDEMPSFTLRETMMGHLALWGNAYAEIDWSNGGEVKGLWPLRPDRTRPRRDIETGKLVYDVSLPNGSGVTLPASRVLHIAGFGFDGLVGHNPIDFARDAIGLSLAAEEFGGRFFGNGAVVSGVLEHPHELGEEGRANVRQSFEEMHSGLSNAHRLMILEEGMKYTQIGIPPQTAQYLETRKFQVNEIARFFRIPPHMIGDLERSTNNNIEQQSIEFVRDTIRPWLVRWEQYMKLKLLQTPREREQYIIEFAVDGLLRGDYKSRQEGLHIMRQDGIINADEWREIENMNPQPDGTGKVYMANGNMLPIQSLQQQSGKGGDNTEK